MTNDCKAKQGMEDRDAMGMRGLVQHVKKQGQEEAPLIEIQSPSNVPM
jgi:hypothetical protein